MRSIARLLVLAVLALTLLGLSGVAARGQICTPHPDKFGPPSLCLP